MAIWEDYYQRFKIKPDAVRPGCEPRIMVQPQNQSREKAIVLIHGLTDSPFFMEAIGECFYQWGYNVFLPLLAGHGLRNPQYLKGVTMEAWLENVDYAIQEAKDKYQCQVISLGGLSLGGAISVLKMFDSPNEVTGGIFLFSATLDIASLAGNLIEKLLRTPILLPILAYLEDKFAQDLIGDNPYKYSRMDNNGARELSKIIKKIDENFNLINKQNILLDHLIFAAHSESDQAADIVAVAQLISKNNPSKTEFFRIAKRFDVPHASLVFKEDLRANNGSLLEAKNPFFDEMMNTANKFQKQHL